jgi:hypothetical protein
MRRLRWRRMPKQIRWPNGSTTSAKTWDELLDVIGRMQWAPRTGQMVRPVLARRAGVWSGRRVTSGGTAEEFCRRLAAAGLFEVIDDR